MCVSEKTSQRAAAVAKVQIVEDRSEVRARGRGGVEVRGIGYHAEKFACCLGGCSGKSVSAQIFIVPSIFIPL